ncbi:unnamed protein product [Schistosoma curassoni]|uniref:Uncharacterized protein n=1 Tax=Schistosoma curassoni TaxID=6186 RepID=A0A183JII7_9TREM|nr:unnamed protein product [Schistosoma curassoni]
MPRPNTTSSSCTLFSGCLTNPDNFKTRSPSSWFINFGFHLASIYNKSNIRDCD